MVSAYFLVADSGIKERYEKFIFNRRNYGSWKNRRIGATLPKITEKRLSRRRLVLAYAPFCRQRRNEKDGYGQYTTYSKQLY